MGREMLVDQPQQAVPVGEQLRGFVEQVPLALIHTHALEPQEMHVGAQRRGSRQVAKDTSSSPRAGWRDRLMPRVCTICSHDEAHTINVALVQRESYRDIARRYGVGKDALSRHAKDHLPELLSKAKAAVEVAEADDLLSRIEALQSRTLAVLEAVEGTENYAVAFGAIREARSNLELIGRVRRELEAAPILNLYLSPEWLELRVVIVCALAPYQEARGAVLNALEGTANGRA